MATQGGNRLTLSAEEVEILNDYRLLPPPQQAACGELLAATVAAVRGDVIGTA